VSSTFRSVVCKVCKKKELCHPGPGGLEMLPFNWERFEDKTLDRKGPLTEICGERCKAKLRELNRSGRAQRMGF
jgi:hypothetical protein